MFSTKKIDDMIFVSKIGATIGLMPFVYTYIFTVIGKYYHKIEITQKVIYQNMLYSVAALFAIGLTFLLLLLFLQLYKKHFLERSSRGTSTNKR